MSACAWQDLSAVPTLLTFLLQQGLRRAEAVLEHHGMQRK